MKVMAKNGAATAWSTRIFLRIIPADLPSILDYLLWPVVSNHGTTSRPGTYHILQCELNRALNIYSAIFYVLQIRTFIFFQSFLKGFWTAVSGLEPAIKCEVAWFWGLSCITINPKFLAQIYPEKRRNSDEEAPDSNPLQTFFRSWKQLRLG